MQREKKQTFRSWVSSNRVNEKGWTKRMIVKAKNRTFIFIRVEDLAKWKHITNWHNCTKNTHSKPEKYTPSEICDLICLPRCTLLMKSSLHVFFHNVCPLSWCFYILCVWCVVRLKSQRLHTHIWRRTRARQRECVWFMFFACAFNCI